MDFLKKVSTHHNYVVCALIIINLKFQIIIIAYESIMYVKNLAHVQFTVLVTIVI